MDNATHTLCGLALARAGLDRLDPRAAATLVLASNLADLDIVVQPFGGRPAYLCYHRGVTHSLLGMALEALLLAGLVLGVERLRGGAPDARRFGRLALVALIGFLAHLGLDGLNSYGIRPLLPFSGRWFYGDVAFIVDPWLWLMLAAAAALGAPPRDPSDARGARPVWGWFLFAALALEAMLLQDRAAAGVIPLVWGAAMAGVIALRARGVGLPRRTPIALAGLGVAVIYLLTLASCSRAAGERARAAFLAGEAGPIERLSAQPEPGAVHAWQVVVSSRARSAVFRVDLWAGTTRRALERPRGLDDPALLAALGRAEGRPEVSAWRCFARHPFLDRDGGLLILGDARYAPEGRVAWCNLAVPFDAGGLTPTSGAGSRSSPPR